MIEIRDMSLAFGERKLFNGISAVINRADKIGLAGSNGAGKSTLLKILAGIEDFDSGRIVRPKYASVGYLAQDISDISSRSLYAEAESAFEDVVGIKRKLEQADEILKASAPDSEQYLQTLEDIGEFERKLEDLDAYKLRSKIETVLSGLGFRHEDMQRPCSEFSGGWRMRIALAKLLLLEPSLLMLDEPTNHLDIESIQWL
ncbi:MAG: ABC-F family ATP-binding cassette domain-containing protein, partial [Opitutales bacterium]|nr:ABC-F family ATP-binding cassette domain-containing protein [Opitutales bacterium]